VSAVVTVPEDQTSFKHKISYLIRELGSVEQAKMPLKHYFQPGVYIREIFMPAGTYVIGKTHKTQHFNIVQTGKLKMISPETLIAPCTFVSQAGVQKVLYIEEDTVWSTVHLTTETDLETLERELIEHEEHIPLFDRTEEREGIELAARSLISLSNDRSDET
jgi:hypothetical protein